MHHDIIAILDRFNSGSARIFAAGVVYALVFAVERLPIVGAFLAKDGPGSLLTSKRKKLAANLLVAMLPAAVLLEAGAPLIEVLSTSLTAALGGHLLNHAANVVRDG